MQEQIQVIVAPDRGRKTLETKLSFKNIVISNEPTLQRGSQHWVPAYPQHLQEIKRRPGLCGMDLPLADTEGQFWDAIRPASGQI